MCACARGGRAAGRRSPRPSVLCACAGPCGRGWRPRTPSCFARPSPRARAWGHGCQPPASGPRVCWRPAPAGVFRAGEREPLLTLTDSVSGRGFSCLGPGHRASLPHPACPTFSNFRARKGRVARRTPRSRTPCKQGGSSLGVQMAAPCLPAGPGSRPRNLHLARCGRAWDSSTGCPAQDCLPSRARCGSLPPRSPPRLPTTGRRWTPARAGPRVGFLPFCLRQPCVVVLDSHFSEGNAEGGV